MSRRVRLSLVCCLLASLALPFGQPSLTLAADGVLDTLAVYRMGEVVVTAPRIKLARLSEVERSAGEIRSTGTLSVSEALTAFTGTLATTGMKSSSQLSIRGFLSNETLVLFDGRPLNSPYYGDVDLNSVPLWGVGKVQVVKGPASSAYGANTLGGMVNIVTDDRIGEMRLPAVTAAFGPDGQRQGSLAYSRALGRFGTWISAGHSAADGFTLSEDFNANSREDGDLRENSDYRHTNLDAKLEYTTPGGSRFSLGVGEYDAERNAPPTSDTTVAAKQVAFDQFPDWTRRYACLNATGVWRGSAVWRTNLYYDTQYDRLIRYKDATYDPEQIKFDSEHDSRASGARAELTYVFSNRWHNSAGVIGRRDGIDRRENRGEPWIHNDAITWSVFDQIRCSVTPRLTLEAGVSINQYLSDEIDASTSSLDPTASAVLDAGRGVTAHLAIAKATRFPTLSHLYSTTSGNPDLKAERALKYDAGISWNATRQIRVTQDVFWNDTEDLIDRLSKEDPYYNALSATLRGAESGIEWHSEAALAGLSVSYLDAKASLPTNDPANDAEQRRRWLPRWKVDYRLETPFVGGVNLNHTGQYIADRVNSNGAAMPDYFVANLRVSRTLGKPVSAFVSLRNIFDRNCEQETGYPMPGRTLLLGIETRP